MRLLMAASLAAALAAPAAAQYQVNRAGKLGLGAVVGNPFGATFKYWLGPIAAVDGALGSDGEAELHADFLLHGWSLPQPSQEGRLGGFVGLGGEIEDRRGGALALRVPFGVSYLTNKNPLELFGELVPTLYGGGSDLDLAFGLRYYF